MRTVTRLAGLTAAAALSLSLAACGSSSGGSAAPSNSGSNSSPATSATSATSSATSATSSAPTADNAAVPDAKTLIHEARSAYKTAKSAALHADTTEDGVSQKTDLKGTMDGTNQDMSVSRGAEGAATVRTVDQKYFIKGNKAFWKTSSKAPETTAALLADKWVKAPSSMVTSLKDLTIANFLDEAIGPKNISDAQLETATTKSTSYDGQAAYVVTSSTTGNTITISADKKYVLEISRTASSSSTESGKITISGWDQQPTLEAPAGAVELPSNLQQ